MYKHLDLFSGIAGFSLGLEATGQFETVAFCEQNEFCQKLLKHHYPEVPIYDDVRTLTAERLERDGIEVTSMSGGFPCQDISTAGPKTGLEQSTRSALWVEYARLIGELRPDIVFVENVSNAIANDSGAWLGAILGDLASLGYDAEWHCVPASAVGAPHKRDRLFIIANPSELGQSQQRQHISALSESPAPFREADHLVVSFQGGALPYVCGRHDGTTSPLDVDRLTAIGNSVVPWLVTVLATKFLGLDK